MEPTLLPGEVVTAWRRFRRLRVGDVVVVLDPRDSDRWIVKRCHALSGGFVELRGDRAEASTDSREFGPLRARDVHYVVSPRFLVMDHARRTIE